MKSNVAGENARKYFAYRHKAETFHGLIEIPFIKRLIRNEVNVKGADILDLGSGFGFYAKYLLERNAKSIECVDRNSELIRLGRNYISDSRVKFKLMDIESFRARNRFDIAFANLSLSNLKSIPGIYRNVRASLRRGGQFIVSELHPIAAVLQLSDKAKYATSGKGYFDIIPGIPDYINLAIQSGFSLKKYYEPSPGAGVRAGDNLRFRASLFPRFFVLLLQRD